MDSDVAPNVRPFVIEYIKNKYGEKAVCQILTRGFFGAKSAINAGARVLGKKMGDDKMFVKLSYEITDKIEDANISIAEIESDILSQFSNNKDVEEILHFAKLIEGRCQNYGTHAAGIVISDNDDISDYLPLIKVTDAIDCSCDLNYVEPLGMLKLDLLGLRNLGIITECEKAVLRSTGEKLSIDTIPADDPDVLREIFAKGKTNGVFQFESDGMKKTLKDFGPESISDLTLLNAIFRPGPLQYIEDVTAVKKGEKKPEYIIPEMEEVLGVTYGKPIYQEQIIAIFNKFAGFSLGTADIIRRHMAKKHFDEFAAYKEQFVEGMVKNGAKPEAVEKFWNELLDFAAYAFNKSHARAYSEIAYATAYLKYHYPEAYTVGLLNYTPSDKREAVLTEAINSGVKVTVPDINIAEEDFILNGNEVVYGLKSITQVAASSKVIIKERNENGAFTSFEDFLKRCRLKKNVLENLIKAGAFDRFCKSREALLVAAAKKTKAIDDLDTWTERLTPGVNEKKRDTINSKLEELKAIIEEPIEVLDDDMTVRLCRERDVIGYFVSGHPVPAETGYKTLNEVVSGNVVVFVNSVEYKKSKRENNYVKITCEDRTGSAECLSFDQSILTNDIIKEGAVLRLNVDKKDDNSFFINKVYSYVKSDAKVIIEVSSWQNFLNSEKYFANYKGNKRLWVFCRDSHKTYPTKLFVSKDVLMSEKIKNI